MPANENKENDLVLSSGLPGEVSLAPQTPAHLLKRTQSTTLKPLAQGEREKTDSSNAVCDGQDKNISPLRKLCAQQGRLPLASKDNNRSNSFIFQSFQQQPQGPSLKRNTSQFKKRKPPLSQNIGTEEGQILSNPRRLKKYGSVLGYNALPKMKSLVLKDLDQSDDDDEGDDLEEDQLLRLKLQEAIKRPNEESARGEVGGLFSKSGLQQLIRESKKDDNEDEDEDREIEFGPSRHPPLPYVPDGYIPLGKEDMDKLKSFQSPYLMANDYFKSSEDTDSGLLNLEEFDSSDEKEEIALVDHPNTRPLAGVNSGDILEIRPKYSGEGLNANELIDLLED